MTTQHNDTELCEFLERFDLYDCQQTDIRQARNLIEYTATIPFDESVEPPEMTAWHARERLHRAHGPAVCYIDPKASQTEVLSYLAAVTQQVIATEWPPRARMSASVDWWEVVSKNRAEARVSNAYTGSSLTVSLHRKDKDTSPMSLIHSMVRAHDEKPDSRGVQMGKHRLRLNVRSPEHLEPLIQRLESGTARHSTVASLFAELNRAEVPF